MEIKVEKNSQMKIPIDVVRMVHNLLKKIPPEHLIGLGSILLVDQLTHKINHGSEGIYWHKRGREPAKIEIALGVIYKGVPKIVFYLPFVSKFMLASVLFHEIGHHYQQHIHGVTKNTEESFAEKYRKRMMRKTFSYWRLLLLPLSPLIFSLNRATNRSRAKKKGSVVL